MRVLSLVVDPVIALWIQGVWSLVEDYTDVPHTRDAGVSGPHCHHVLDLLVQVNPGSQGRSPEDSHSESPSEFLSRHLSIMLVVGSGLGPFAP